MKIVFLTKRFSPDIGGVEEHALEVAQILIREGHTVTIVTESQGNKNVDGIQVIRLPYFADGKMKKFQIWKWMLQNTKLFITADIIHVHDVFFWILPIRILFPWKPIFITFHGYETVVPPTKKSILLRKVYEFLAWGNICVGKYLTKWYGTKANYITYGGVSTGGSGKGIGGSKKLQIAFLGRLEKDNDIDMYLQAVEILKKKKISFEFTAIGDGSYRKEVEKLGKVTGFITDVHKYLGKIDILFASSYLSILDGFAQNTLVMAAYSNPLKKDYLEMTPFASYMIQTDQADTIAENSVAYTHNPQNYLDMITDAYEYAKENSWEEVTQAYHRLWKK